MAFEKIDFRLLWEHDQDFLRTVSAGCKSIYHRKATTVSTFDEIKSLATDDAKEEALLKYIISKGKDAIRTMEYIKQQTSEFNDKYKNLVAKFSNHELKYSDLILTVSNINAVSILDSMSEATLQDVNAIIKVGFRELEKEENRQYIHLMLAPVLIFISLAECINAIFDGQQQNIDDITLALLGNAMFNPSISNVSIRCQDSEDVLKNIRRSFHDIISACQHDGKFMVEIANDFKKAKSVNVRKLLYKYKYYKKTRPESIFENYKDR